MEAQAWYASFTERPRPTISQILYDLKKKVLQAPIFVCLQCAKETHSQQAMAAHCRQHVRAGMGKGTVEHIKYYPDHTFLFLCNNNPPQPNPQPPRSTGQQVMAEPTPQPVNQVPIGMYNRILPYTGCFSKSDSAKYPWLQLNGSRHIVNPRATHENLQQPRHSSVGGGLSSLFPSGGEIPSYIMTRTTSAPIPPKIDLTLRLGPTPPTEVSMPGTSFPSRNNYYF